ncbi:hypothetical protein HDU82_006301 [Entophlyctis luteolus]|nr:hypothetical protein HDU82_006301 [Entophlyctis luteolus]
MALAAVHHRLRALASSVTYGTSASASLSASPVMGAAVVAATAVAALGGVYMLVLVARASSVAVAGKKAERIPKRKKKKRTPAAVAAASSSDAAVSVSVKAADANALTCAPPSVTVDLPATATSSVATSSSSSSNSPGDLLVADYSATFVFPSAARDDHVEEIPVRHIPPAAAVFSNHSAAVAVNSADISRDSNRSPSFAPAVSETPSVPPEQKLTSDEKIASAVTSNTSQLSVTSEERADVAIEFLHPLPVRAAEPASADSFFSFEMLERAFQEPFAALISASGPNGMKEIPFAPAPSIAASVTPESKLTRDTSSPPPPPPQSHLEATEEISAVRYLPDFHEADTLSTASAIQLATSWVDFSEISDVGEEEPDLVDRSGDEDICIRGRSTSPVPRASAPTVSESCLACSDVTHDPKIPMRDSSTTRPISPMPTSEALPITPQSVAAASTANESILRLSPQNEEVQNLQNSVLSNTAEQTAIRSKSPVSPTSPGKSRERRITCEALPSIPPPPESAANSAAARALSPVSAERSISPAVSKKMQSEDSSAEVKAEKSRGKRAKSVRKLGELFADAKEFVPSGNGIRFVSAVDSSTATNSTPLRVTAQEFVPSVGTSPSTDNSSSLRPVAVEFTPWAIDGPGCEAEYRPVPFLSNGPDFEMYNPYAEGETYDYGESEGNLDSEGHISDYINGGMLPAIVSVPPTLTWNPIVGAYVQSEVSAVQYIQAETDDHKEGENVPMEVPYDLAVANGRESGVGGDRQDWGANGQAWPKFKRESHNRDGGWGKKSGGRKKNTNQPSEDSAPAVTLADFIKVDRKNGVVAVGSGAKGRQQQSAVPQAKCRFGAACSKKGTSCSLRH